jgi:hypothetical protein
MRCKHLIAACIFLLLPLSLRAQIRCFEFGWGAYADWRDSSCVACTSDPAVLAEVQSELALPMGQRTRHINGYIAGGHGGRNKNGSHQFLWHFKLNEWRLAELSMEVCDGRPYSDVDQDTLYWIYTVRQFCPWSSLVRREIPTLGTGREQPVDWQLSLFPNPVVREATLVSGKAFRGSLEITDLSGRTVHRETVQLAAGGQVTIGLEQLPAGCYFLRLADGDGIQVLRLNKV